MRRILTALITIATFFTLAALNLSSAAAQESSSADTATGIAACYSSRLAGHRTSSGKRYDPNLLTAAHATMPIGTRVKVTDIENDQTVVVLVNDRLSAHAGGGIIMDISQRACRELKFGPGGKAKVKLEVLSSNTPGKSH